MRVFFDSIAKEAREFESTNERPSLKVIEAMGKDGCNIHAMRLGPGKFLKGLKLPGGVKPEEFDYFVSSTFPCHNKVIFCVS